MTISVAIMAHPKQLVTGVAAALALLLARATAQLAWAVRCLVLRYPRMDAIAARFAEIADEAALHVLGVADRFEVGGVDAVRRATEVVQFQAIGHGPDQLLVGRPVSKDHDAVSGDPPVARVVQSPTPQPTAVVVNRVVARRDAPSPAVVAVYEPQRQPGYVPTTWIRSGRDRGSATATALAEPGRDGIYLSQHDAEPTPCPR